jgi:hypothetical protein
MDKTYIEALMQAPSREQEDITASDAVQKRWNSEMERIKSLWQDLQSWAQENNINIKKCRMKEM